MEVSRDALASGGDPNVSDAFTINGQPGDLYPCSESDTFRLMVDNGKTYSLQIVNAAMNIILLFSIKSHQLIIVGSDGNYNKPLTVDYIAISPGQTIDRHSWPTNNLINITLLLGLTPLALESRLTTPGPRLYCIQYTGIYPSSS
ncbi:hypothetical protein CRG98_040838 [Punica granatum]|nr:hypothetical protein CRG98_040838 [Punica granatum]